MHKKFSFFSEQPFWIVTCHFHINIQFFSAEKFWGGWPHSKFWHVILPVQIIYVCFGASATGEMEYKWLTCPAIHTWRWSWEGSCRPRSTSRSWSLYGATCPTISSNTLAALFYATQFPSTAYASVSNSIISCSEWISVYTSSMSMSMSNVNLYSAFS